MTENQQKTFSVLVLDMFHYIDPEHEFTISGFPTLDTAREFARRWTRSSLEDLRKENIGAEELKDLWHNFGEDCIVIGGNYAGSSELQFFIDHPAIPEEINFNALKPDE